MPEHRLITLTWGNVSGVVREKGQMVIKPSRVEYDGMQPENMVMVSLPPMQQELLDKHYLRKHGPGAYYGQG